MGLISPSINTILPNQITEKKTIAGLQILCSKDVGQEIDLGLKLVNKNVDEWEIQISHSYFYGRTGHKPKVTF